MRSRSAVILVAALIAGVGVGAYSVSRYGAGGRGVGAHALVEEIEGGPAHGRELTGGAINEDGPGSGAIAATAPVSEAGKAGDGVVRDTSGVRERRRWRAPATVEAAPPAVAVAPPSVAPPEPVVPTPVAREALAYVGADAEAEAVWYAAINDPTLSAHDRSDLIEDLNEDGFPDPAHVTADDLPLIVNRLALIEQVAGDAMDETNAAAFAEAYKDLVNMYAKVTAEQ